MKKVLNNLMAFLCLLGILNTSCTKESIDADTSQTMVMTASKTFPSHLNVSNDDDDFTDILINDLSGQPVIGLTATITDLNDPSISHVAVSNSNGWAFLGEVAEGTYSLIITVNGVIIPISTLVTLSRNDFEVVLGI